MLLTLESLHISRDRGTEGPAASLSLSWLSLEEPSQAPVATVEQAPHAQPEWARALLWLRGGAKQWGSIMQGDLRPKSFRMVRFTFSAKNFHVQSLNWPGNGSAKPKESREKEL